MEKVYHNIPPCAIRTLGERALPLRRPRQAVRLTYVRFTVLWLLFLSFARFTALKLPITDIPD